jgi:hypothetical protein
VTFVRLKVAAVRTPAQPATHSELNPAHHWPSPESNETAEECRGLVIAAGERQPLSSAGAHRGMTVRSRGLLRRTVWDRDSVPLHNPCTYPGGRPVSRELATRNVRPETTVVTSASSRSTPRSSSKV